MFTFHRACKVGNAGKEKSSCKLYSYTMISKEISFAILGL
jgi:hypothetical protein